MKYMKLIIIVGFYLMATLSWGQPQNGMNFPKQGQNFSGPQMNQPGNGFMPGQNKGPGQGQGPGPGGNNSGQGPWNSNLTLAIAEKGKASPYDVGQEQTIIYRASVPNALMTKDNKIALYYQWFTYDRKDAFDKIAVSYSFDEGQSWTQGQPIVVENLPSEYQRPFDPTVVLTEKGQYRLYFTCQERPQQQNGMAQFQVGRICSAVSNDGIRFTFEAGERLGREQTDLRDCAVVRLKNKWHMFTPVKNSPHQGHHAISNDGLNFQWQEDVTLSGAGMWLGNAWSDGTAMYFIGTDRDGPWIGKSNDGQQWSMVGHVLARGADPAYVIMPSGRGAAILINVSGQ